MPTNRPTSRKGSDVEQEVHHIPILHHMQEALPFDYLPERAEAVQPVLQRMVTAAMAAVGIRQ